MRSDSLFRRLVLGLVITVALTMVVSGGLVVRDVDESLNQALLDSLDSQATLLLPFARDDFATDSFSPARQEGVRQDLSRLKEAHGIRVTFIQRDGEVLLDTHATGGMENHRRRPEVDRALVDGTGQDRRVSATLGQEFVYLARVEDPSSGRHGVVRVAAPYNRIESRIGEAQADVLVGAGIAGLLAMLLGLLLAGRLARPVVEMTNVAEQLRAGNFGARVEEVGTGELGVLGDALNRLGGELSAKIETLSADEAQLRAMLAGMVEGVVAVDPKARLVFSNRAARDVLGFRQADAVRGVVLWSLIDSPPLVGLVEEARGSDSDASAELALPGSSGDRIVLAKAHRYMAHGQISVVVVLEDVTELRRLETVRRDFVANVSHELKTPLTSIRGFVETLLQGAVDDPEINRRFLGKVNDSVARLGALVSDLLSLARIEAQEGSLTLARVDWRQVAEGCLRRAEDFARRRNIELTTDLEQGDLSVVGDDEALTQVVDNLVDNAIKYTPEGGAVTVRLFRTGESFVTLEVQDTGIGIPEEDQERVFERFYRVDKARSREVGGTGLGLAIVKHLVVAMQGELELESRKGEGSTFRVVLEQV